MIRTSRLLVLTTAVAGALATSAQEIAPFYSGSYNLLNLGSVPGVPTNYGGLVFKSGTQDRILIGGAANGINGIFYEIELHRNAEGHVDGFIGNAVPKLAAPYNDGGVEYHPQSGVLFYSMWPVNQLGQFKPGSVSADKVIDLNGFNVSSSHAALTFLPSWIPGPSRRLMLSSWSGGDFYAAQTIPDGIGTYDLGNLTYETTLTGGPEGLLYVPPGSPLFPDYSMLVCEYSSGTVVAYEVDSNGIPNIATRSEFVTSLYGAEGAVIDPATGDFMFSTFGGFNQVIVVGGFATQKLIRGNVELQDYDPFPSNQAVTFEIRNVGGTSPLETRSVTPDDDGDYSFVVNVGEGDYDITAKGSHWLRSLNSNIAVGETGANNVNFSLVNGDTDPDNEVNLVDFGQLSAAFGSILGDSNWNPQADLDGDGEVTLVDYGILAARFGQAGDE